MSDLRTPLKRARGVGAGSDGVHHYIVQRVTSLALIPLGLWLIWVGLSLAHASYEQARGLVGVRVGSGP